MRRKLVEFLSQAKSQSNEDAALSQINPSYVAMALQWAKCEFIACSFRDSNFMQHHGVAPPITSNVFFPFISQHSNIILAQGGAWRNAASLLRNSPDFTFKRVAASWQNGNIFCLLQMVFRAQLNFLQFVDETSDMELPIINKQRVVSQIIVHKQKIHLHKGGELQNSLSCCSPPCHVPF